MDLKTQAPKNITIIDAPMSGATVAANKGTLTFMVGCEKKLFCYIEPLLKLMGTQINHIGNFGSGMMVKVLNNFIAASSVVSVRHVLPKPKSLIWTSRSYSKLLIPLLVKLGLVLIEQV